MLYYKKRKSNRVHYIKIVLLVVLIILSILNPIISKVSSNVVLLLVKPLTEISSFINNEIEGLVEATIGTRANREQIDKLSQEKQILEAENIRLKDIINNSKALKEEFEFSEHKKSVKARVLTLEDTGYFSNFTIDKGSRDGIKEGDLVLSNYSNDSKNIVGALIGRVEEVTLTGAKVSSLMDDRFNLTFTNSENRDLGIINGRFEEQFEGYMLDKDSTIKIGDSIYTSGIGGVYAKGIYIGQVTEVKDTDDKIQKLVKIKSPVNFKKIYNVFVVGNTGVNNE